MILHRRRSRIAIKAHYIGNIIWVGDDPLDEIGSTFLSRLLFLGHFILALQPSALGAL
jgi:hypothetical protein